MTVERQEVLCGRNPTRFVGPGLAPAKADASVSPWRLYIFDARGHPWQWEHSQEWLCRKWRRHSCLRFLPHPTKVETREADAGVGPTARHPPMPNSYASPNPPTLLKSNPRFAEE